MGTPDFAVPSLEMLINKHDVVGVFTMPDRPSGRGRKMKMPPVKEVAVKHNIPVYQPERIKNHPEVTQQIKDLNPDLIAVAAYGQILPKEVLDIPKYGCINVHASLLPKLRGAAPINWAIINGMPTTGVTTMMMGEGLDTGDMLLKKEIEIKQNENAGELFDRLMYIGAELLDETIDGIEKNEIVPVKQDDSQSTYAPMMKKELGHLDFSKTASQVHDLARGVTPWPGAYALYNGKTIKIWSTELKEGQHNEEYGVIKSVTKKYVEVLCKEGSILIKEIQDLGGKRMDIASYINGHTINVGEKFE